MSKGGRTEGLAWPGLRSTQQEGPAEKKVMSIPWVVVTCFFVVWVAPSKLVQILR